MIFVKNRTTFSTCQISSCLNFVVTHCRMHHTPFGQSFKCYLHPFVDLLSTSSTSSLFLRGQASVINISFHRRLTLIFTRFKSLTVQKKTLLCSSKDLSLEGSYFVKRRILCKILTKRV